MVSRLLFSFKKALRNPVFWFGVIMLLFSYYRFNENYQEGSIIRGDAKGYYAVLPAFFTYEDPSFERSTFAENYHQSNPSKPDYLVLADNGKTYNKYFPGVAMLQAPFYSMATVKSIVMVRTADGYTGIYQFFFYLGHTFYALLGLILFYAFLIKLFPEKRTLIQWMIPVIYLATPLFHYSVNTLSYSHSYSIFLLAGFGILILKMRNSVGLWNFFCLGLITGMIALVRPTNLIIILLIPFLLGSRDHLYSFLNQLLEKRARKLLIGILGFSIILTHLILIWKWQTGQWVVGSYGNSEGFNFMSPEIINSLFSFRIGLFLHTPILILSIIGLIVLFKKDKFKAIWWTLYFLVNAWVISAWWCWDYESTFGNRPYTEHLIFLILPLFALMTEKRKWIYPIVGLFTLVGFVRIYTYNTGAMTNQRFTSDNYISSLAFWNSENNGRWAYTKSCKPYGQMTNEFVLFENKGIYLIHARAEFSCPGTVELPKLRENERYYYRVSLDKKVAALPFNDVNIVIDGTRNDGSHYYTAIPLSNDKLEGLNDWKHLEFEGVIPDNLQEMQSVKIYLWNRGRHEFEVRDLKIAIEEYKG